MSDCLTLFAQCLASGVFVVSAVSKLRDVPGFGVTVQRLAPIPSRVALGLAWTVVLAELLTAGVVWYGDGRPGLLLAGLLSTGLAGIAFRATALPVPVPCRCFGRSTAPLGARHGIRNLVLAALMVAGLVTAGADRPVPPLGGIALAVAAAAVGVIVTVYLDDLAELARP
ncbi:MauE/DoxX family redox-associated membrane protein [Kribbella sp. NPDC026611]|uniref:MauE/DoxX family redox-associated membrane protein n=1 Tax=Kribbella sp. NPDC026611 TaxID=3154911 RepID=UPI00340D4B01